MHLHLVLLCSLFKFIDAASIITRSQTTPLDVVGPATNLTISSSVIAPDGFPRSATLAGGTFPGPLIKATKGDQFAINVVNELTDPEMLLSTSVHWHGIHQNRTNAFDGPAFITQCPIVPNGSFLYQFDANGQAGTFWYHAHYHTQRCDGLEGPLIIYDPDDPYQYLYDVDDETTVITLSDWYHLPAPVLSHIIDPQPNATLFNGLGRYAGGPQSDLAVVNVEYGKRYRFRLLSMSCSMTFQFSIDGHNFTIIEADGESTTPLLVDSLQILSGQRYSIVLNATQPVGNYWMRALPNTNFTSNFNGGQNSAILRYSGAPIQEPTTENTTSVVPFEEQNLHALLSPTPPGIPGYGNADINIELVANLTKGAFSVNGVRFQPPTVPVLLQILSGVQKATDLLPQGSVYALERDKVVELTVKITGDDAGGPHPIHLHGHSFYVVQSAGDNTTTFNYENPVRRDTVSAGVFGQQTVIRFTADNVGPWLLHCHIDWHFDAGFGVVMAEDIGDVSNDLVIPTSWDGLCPAFDVLSPSQLGAVNAVQEAANITTLLIPNRFA